MSLTEHAAQVETNVRESDSNYCCRVLQRVCVSVSIINFQKMPERCSRGYRYRHLPAIWPFSHICKAQRPLQRHLIVSFSEPYCKDNRAKQWWDIWIESPQQQRPDSNTTNRPWRTARSRVTSITHVVYFAYFYAEQKKKHALRLKQRLSTNKILSKSKDYELLDSQQKASFDMGRFWGTGCLTRQ